MKTKQAPQRREKGKKRSNGRARWLLTVFLLTILISAGFSFLAQKLLGKTSLFGAFLVLLAIISIGILFDVLGVAVTAADEKPFHSMASRKVVGAAEAIRLIRSADRVSSICNDIVGDICGVISGAAAALIAAEAFLRFESVPLTAVQLILSALVASLTITGKAFCKYVALENSTAIVHTAARIIHLIQKPFRKQKKR